MVELIAFMVTMLIAFVAGVLYGISWLHHEQEQRLKKQLEQEWLDWERRHGQ